MSYQIIQAEESRSFPEAHAFFELASKDGAGVMYIGADAGEAYDEAREQHAAASFVALELENECLGVHITDDNGPVNVVGFARFRLGDDAPTQLVELVRMPYTSDAALAAAKAAFVRSLIRPASSSATEAICVSRKRPIAPVGTCGRSQKTRSTSLATSERRRSTLRVRRSSLANTNVAPVALA